MKLIRLESLLTQNYSIRILIPFVSNAKEVIAVRREYYQICDTLNISPMVEIGAMLERINRITI
ncbi:hypothetical protein QA601_00915 [Chitinispirillales bacterium ANBcel5]|uniref:hypothetical protein n=1 Tax=Cellulosispirillum alkaliphilum TaxID=3039283 RepID=UPI002A51149E|nr:hypothetical protein [Chitinispirillales bacterium ANBcel5]